MRRAVSQDLPAEGPPSVAKAVSPSRRTFLRVGAARLWQVAGVLVAHGAAMARDRLSDRWPRLGRYLPAGERVPPAHRLRVVLEDLGATFIKFGQMLALQPDLISIEQCNALFKLLDRVEPFAWHEVERIMVEEFAQRPDELFDSFERQPLAAASVGQVHVATLDGSRVAVKVQRPDARQQFGSDVRLMLIAMKGIRWLRLRPFYWLLEPIEEFARWTQEELDYRHEARCSERLRDLAVGSSAQYVPKVYASHSTSRVLTVEFLDGVTLLDYLRAREENNQLLLRRLQEMGFDHDAFARNIIDTFLGNAFSHGIYHADLHPANLMILPNSVVGYIDFGITGVMSPHTRKHLMLMTLGLAVGDRESIVREFLRITVYGPQADIEGFRSGLDRAASSWYGNGRRHDGLSANFTRVMQDMLLLSRQYNIMPERDVIKYIRSSIAIDGLITRFAPGFELGPHLGQACGEQLRAQLAKGHLTGPRFADFSSATGRLMEDGLLRGAKVLERLVERRGRSPLAGRQQSGGGRLGGASGALELGAMALVVALLMLVTPGDRLGLNLVTAELGVGVLALVLLARSVLKDAMRRPIRNATRNSTTSRGAAGL